MLIEWMAFCLFTCIFHLLNVPSAIFEILSTYPAGQILYLNVKCFDHLFCVFLLWRPVIFFMTLRYLVGSDIQQGKWLLPKANNDFVCLLSESDLFFKINVRYVSGYIPYGMSIFVLVFTHKFDGGFCWIIYGELRAYFGMKTVNPCVTYYKRHFPSGLILNPSVLMFFARDSWLKRSQLNNFSITKIRLYNT